MEKCNFCDRYDNEMAILKETPYNWKKHALFMLPEVFIFTIKLLLIFVTIHLFMTEWTIGMIQHFPTYCSLLK